MKLIVLVKFIDTFKSIYKKGQFACYVAIGKSKSGRTLMHQDVEEGFRGYDYPPFLLLFYFGILLLIFRKHETFLIFKIFLFGLWPGVS